MMALYLESWKWRVKKKDNHKFEREKKKRRGKTKGTKRNKERKKWKSNKKHRKEEKVINIKQKNVGKINKHGKRFWKSKRILENLESKRRIKT